MAVQWGEDNEVHIPKDEENEAEECGFQDDDT